MRTKATTPRRRCYSCREWFRPKSSSLAHQKTCSAECRRRRLRTLAKRRREQDLERYHYARLRLSVRRPHGSVRPSSLTCDYSNDSSTHLKYWSP